MAISCASIPRELIEAELFGYVSGSFTGANKNGAIGKFELAQNGTLFLDEIGSLPLEAQGKLLRALQQNEIVRIGGKMPIPVNVNVISANNVDLRELVKTKMFREDLLYRLNTVEIAIPPLRERAGDTELLIKHFVEGFARLQKRRMKISTGWMEAMVQHAWRGNVRELEHACEAAMILLFVMVMRNSVQQFLFSLAYERGLRWHIWLGYVAVVTSIGHGFHVSACKLCMSTHACVLYCCYDVRCSH